MKLELVYDVDSTGLWHRCIIVELPRLSLYMTLHKRWWSLFELFPLDNWIQSVDCSLPRDAMLARYMLSLCSVCLSVTHRYCTKMAKRGITQTMPYNRLGALLFVAKDLSEIPTGSPTVGVQNRGGVGSNWRFSNESRYISTSTSVFGDWRISTHADSTPTRNFTNSASLAWCLRRRISMVMFTSRWAWTARWPIWPILGFLGAKFPKMWDSLPWTPMNRCAKYDTASFILRGEIRNRNNIQKTNKQTEQ